MSDPGIQAAIAAIDRKIDELQRAKETLLGLSDGPAGDRPVTTHSNGTPIVGDSLAAVREQEFAGMSIAKAAAAFLRKIGRHEKTPVILAALQKGGVEIGSKNPMPAVYTTLWRRPGFVSLGKNYWDLAERRPDYEKKSNPKLTGKRKWRRNPNRAATTNSGKPTKTKVKARGKEESPVTPD
jgi:DNA-directed RNA polymerase delta subunit